jgi:hypothetical protein
MVCCWDGSICFALEVLEGLLASKRGLKRCCNSKPELLTELLV